MAEMIEYLAGTPNEPSSNPLSPDETKKFFTCYFHDFRENGCVLYSAGVFKGKISKR